MTKEKLTEFITEYLNEQEVPYLKELCIKAAKQGYSFSDEMYEEETAEFIPTDEEILEAIQQERVITDVEILLKSSECDVYVNDDQRIGFQKGAKWIRNKLRHED